MRIMVISTDSGASDQQLQEKTALLQRAASPDTRIVIDCQRATEVCVDSNVDVVVTGPETLLRAVQAEKDGFDAVCLYCGSDPGHDACRELLHIPVIGAAHASFAMAMCLGYRYSFITTSARRIPQKTEFIRSCGVDMTRLASVRSIEYDYSASHDKAHWENTVRLLSDAAKLCAERDGADVVVLGCLSFAGMGAEISARSGVTTVDPAFAMITMAEAVVRQGISHSKIAYPTPPPARRGWSGGTLNT